MKKLLSLFLGFILTASVAYAGARDDFKGSVNTLILSAGTANYKAFMNSAGNQFEWATGIKIGTFTIDLSADSADVAYTGIGFKPSVVMFFLSPPSSSAFQYASWGFSDGTSHLGLSYSSQLSSFIPLSDIGTSCIGVHLGSGIYKTAVIKTMDTDGFTLTWVTTGSMTGIAKVFYIAFR